MSFIFAIVKRVFNSYKLPQRDVLFKKQQCSKAGEVEV